MAKQSKNVEGRSFRKIENCRVRDIGIEKLAECLQPGPSTCSHALPFGYCFLCKHPRLDEIMENTRKAQASGEVLR